MPPNLRVREAPPSGLHGGAVFAGVLAALAVGFGSAAGLTVAAAAGAMAESLAARLSFALGLAGVAVGAAVGARRARRAGLLHGTVIGLAFVLLSAGAGSLLPHGGAAAPGFWLRLAAGLGLGALGGAAGILL